jgi:hypothetical protein
VTCLGGNFPCQITNTGIRSAMWPAGDLTSEIGKPENANLRSGISAASSASVIVIVIEPSNTASAVELTLFAVMKLRRLCGAGSRRSARAFPNPGSRAFSRKGVGLVARIHATRPRRRPQPQGKDRHSRKRIHNLSILATSSFCSSIRITPLWPVSYHVAPATTPPHRRPLPHATRRPRGRRLLQIFTLEKTCQNNRLLDSSAPPIP